MNSLFQNIVNFRDVGGVVNDCSGKLLLKEGQLYRSARLDNASSADRDKLLNQYKIKTVIDLRTKTELLERASQLQSGQTVQSLMIPGITYSHININGSKFTSRLASRLTWSQYGRLALFALLGYRIEAASIVGTNVIQPGGLVGLAIDTIDTCGREICEFMRSLADSSNYPILIHCTQGKDRTGLLTMLVLSLLGVSVDTIKYDYLLSQGNLDTERSIRIKELSTLGLGEEFANCDESLISTLQNHIIGKRGSIDKYLESIGVNQALQTDIKGNLLC